MAEVVLDILINDNIRVFIQHFNNMYRLNYINRYYEYILIYDSDTYNKAYNEYIKIRNNATFLQNLREHDFLNWMSNN